VPVPVSLYWLITTTSVLQHKHSPSMYQKCISQDDIILLCLQFCPLPNQLM